jgi:hypothetical protein
MMMRAIRHAHPREKKPEEIVDLRDGAHRGPRIVRGGLLIDRNRRGKPFDRIDIGFIDPAEELPSVRAQRFDVASLPFGVNRIKSQGGFATAREPGEYGQGIFRDHDIDVFKLFSLAPLTTMYFLLSIMPVIITDNSRTHAKGLTKRKMFLPI